MMKLLFIILLIIHLNNTHAVEITKDCSRIASIGGKKVYIDSSSGIKGEGLKSYLSNDKIAMKYLRVYQENNQVKFRNIAIGTSGTALLLSGVMFAKNKNTKETLTLGGAALVLANILINTTFRFYNEANLEKAISTYNKKNNPKIVLEFEKHKEDKRSTDSKKVYFGGSWSF